MNNDKEDMDKKCFEIIDKINILNQVIFSDPIIKQQHDYQEKKSIFNKRFMEICNKYNKKKEELE